MSDDPYAILGVNKASSQDEIQKAYRQLAKKLHPDLNPGNKKTEEEFKKVSAAYDVLGDADKRARYDRGEIDAGGAERPKREYYREYAGSTADKNTPTQMPTAISLTVTTFSPRSFGVKPAAIFACAARMRITDWSSIFSILLMAPNAR